MGRTQLVPAAAGLLLADGVDAVVRAAAGVAVAVEPAGAVVVEGLAAEVELGEAVTVLVTVLVEWLDGIVAVHLTPEVNDTLPLVLVVIEGAGLVTTQEAEGAVAAVAA